MKRRLLLLGLALVAGIAALAAWLGPAAIGWSLRASFSPASTEKVWERVPAGAPGVAACRLQGLLGSPVGRQLRPELSALAAQQGADLAWFEQRLEEVVVVHDGDATGYALGRRLDLSPLLIARFDERWGPVEGSAGRRGASDGLLSLFPLEPGLVLATEASASGRALQMATGVETPHPPLPLDEPGEVLSAGLEITPALRLRLRRSVDPRALPVVESLARAQLRVTALDELEAHLELGCHDEAAAATVQSLLQQADFAARAARRAGALADALLGRSAAALKQLPPLEIARTGEVVLVETRMGADEIRPWLRRAIEAIGDPG